MYIKLDERKYKVFFAHTCKDKPKESLIEHSNLTKTYLEKIIKEKNLSKLIDNIIINLDTDNFALIKKLFYNAIYLHDLGKVNPSFQANKMNNDLFEKTTISSEHSIHSVHEFKDIFFDEVESITDDKVFDKINYIFNTFSYSIMKHHGKLDSIKDFQNEKDTAYKSVKNKIDKYITNYFEFYILNKLLFSLLISSDYYATSHYMANLSIEDFGIIKNRQKILEKFEDYEIVKNIRNNVNLNDINKLRSNIFLEAEENLLKNLNKNIFYLEAPTGSGKTITSINLAMNFIKKDENLNKIFYIFPFNTLVEQTKKQLDKIFTNIINIEVINSITPMKDVKDEEQENEESSYEKSYINRLFFHSELILTTHVSLFNILFGVTKEDNFPLWQLANSVIIIDEIQSYNINLWSYMIKFFSHYAKALNMKIVIMSATLPKLDELIKSDDSIFTELITNKDRYFQSKFFKNRVDIDFELLDKYEKIKDEELIEKLYTQKDNYSKIVFEFIKKSSARDFYNKLHEDGRFFEFEICELSGDDNKATRQYVIDKTRQNVKIIIIATQVIEAGVDIDMDLGFKDISTLDSEEQFLGRVNRSCLKLNLKHKPKVYFFNKDDANKIYGKDYRLEFNLSKDNIKELLLNKDFRSFYHEVFKKIKNKDTKIEIGILENFESFEADVLKLNYKSIKDKMKLIENQNLRLFFPFKLDISKYKIDEFKNLHEIKIFLSEDERMLDGQKVWDEFVKLNEIENYAKQQVKRSKINSLMQFFTFNIFKNDKAPIIGDEFFGFYFIGNHEKYIKDGKFDREVYYKSTNSEIID